MTTTHAPTATKAADLAVEYAAATRRVGLAQFQVARAIYDGGDMDQVHDDRDAAEAAASDIFTRLLTAIYNI